MRKPPASEVISSWSLERFRHAGLVVTIWSDVLGEELALVSDNAPDRLLEALAVPAYRVAELLVLLEGPTEAELRWAQHLKRVFPGATLESIQVTEPN